MKNIIITCLLFLSANATAIQITYNFSGTITEINNNVYNNVNEFAGTNIGDTFSGSVSYNAQGYARRSDSLSQPVSTYDYFDIGPTGMSMSVSFGAYNLSTENSYPPRAIRPPDIGRYSRIRVFNDLPYSNPVDAITFESQSSLPSGNFSGRTIVGNVRTPIIFLGLSLQSYDLTTLLSQELPTNRIDLSSLERANFSIIGGFPNIFLRGQLSSLNFVESISVPEPSSLLLMLLAFGLLILMRIRT